MAKYRHKIRLNKLTREKGKVDELIQYLVLEGYSDEVVNDVINYGIELFVAAWEDSVKSIESLYDPDEYDHDVYPRNTLYLVMKHARPEQISPFQERIELADARFRTVTIETEYPLRHVESPEKDVRWWLYRDPIRK